MKFLITTLVTFGYISAIIGVAFLILLIIKKSTFYPSNRQKEVSDNIFELKHIVGILMTISISCFFSSKQIIKYEFKKTLQQNKIISFELDSVFFSEKDIEHIFNNFESTEGRFRCESFSGFINFDDGENIPVQVFRHCYDKNRYIIISKKYSVDATIGEIKTSAFDYIKKDTVQ